MKILTASEVRANLYRLIDETAESHQPIAISGKRSNAVLVAADDWSAIQETLHLLSMPGMGESIKAGLAEPVDTPARPLSSGDLAPRLHQAGPEGRTQAGLGRPRRQSEALLAIVESTPFQTPPPYERLVGDLTGAYSRRINIQHRLVYQVLESERVFKVIRLWTHYG